MLVCRDKYFRLRSYLENNENILNVINRWKRKCYEYPPQCVDVTKDKTSLINYEATRLSHNGRAVELPINVTSTLLSTFHLRRIYS